MRQYRLRALVTLQHVARDGPARDLPGRAHALTAPACYLIQPRYQHDYFPAVIIWDEEPPPPAGGRAVLTIALADGEAETFFAPGQRFAIWADGAVGRTIRAEGLVGYGVISPRTSPAPARPGRGRMQEMAAGADHGHRSSA